MMRSLLRSLLRILGATLAALGILLGLAAAAITQPTFGVLPARGGPPADPDRLRRHVEFLTVQASPRDSDHPETLDKAATYVRRNFEQTHASVRDQTFQVRGRTYRNVIASFGPTTARFWSSARTMTASAASDPIQERTTTPAAPRASSSSPASSTAEPFRRGSSW